MTTEQKPAESESEEMPGTSDPDQTWCICNGDPNESLCGASMNGPCVPDAEVPDEQTCPDRLRIERLIAASIERNAPRPLPTHLQRMRALREMNRTIDRWQASPEWQECQRITRAALGQKEVAR